MSLRRISAILTTLLLATFMAQPWSFLPAQADEPDPPDSGLTDLDKAYLGHTSLDPVIKGQEIQAGANFDAEGEATTEDTEGARTAGVPTTPNVTQNDICNDQKDVLEEGVTQLFTVHDFNLNMDRENLFTLVSITPHVYMWVDTVEFTSGVTTQEMADQGAADFEDIYEIDREYFGRQPQCNRLPDTQPPRLEEIWGTPWYDADDDPHINILNFPIQVGAIVVAGYYSSADEYPTSINANSNECECFYMNSTLFPPGGETYAGILAHEFYHMIQFTNDANEETWVNEGMADIAIEVNGFGEGTASHISDYESVPEDQLTDWGGQLADYGNAYSFLSYFLSHYSGQDASGDRFKAMTEAITKTAADGLEGLQEVKDSESAPDLAAYYNGTDIDDVYQDRAVANIINNKNIAAGQYGYDSPLQGLRVQPHGEFSDYPQSESGEHNVYGDRYYVFNSDGSGDFSIDAQPEIPIVDNEAGMPSPTHEAWGNRGDEMETFMTREAVLPAATTPSLEFGYWFDIEEDWDYVYLEVSEDDGETWTGIACCGGTDPNPSRTTNPNGNNDYPAPTGQGGLTGQSGQVAPGVPTGASWQDGDVDLTQFAGETILIRFRYSTDAAVTNPGFTLDDIALTGAGAGNWALEDFESGPGSFELGGSGAKQWLIIEPSQQNNLRLQLVKLAGNNVTVSRPTTTYPGDAHADGAMNAEQTIAIFTSQTSITSEPFTYDWTATAVGVPERTAPVLEDPGDEVKRNRQFTLEWSDAQPPAPNYRVEQATILRNFLNDNAEDGTGKWEVTSTGNPGIIEWDAVDPSADPASGNPPTTTKTNSGDMAFRANAPDGAVVTDASTFLTLDRKVRIPTEGNSTLTFYNWFVAEGDDNGAVEVQIGDGEWQELLLISRSELAPDAALAFEEEPLELRTIDLAQFKGETIGLRFRFSVGAENRSGSVPYGFYIDDIVIGVENWKFVRTVNGRELETQRFPGIYHFRVQGVYTPFVRGPFSNVEDITVFSICGEGAAHGTIYGTKGADDLRGTESDDVIIGFNGDDRIRGLGGDDRICGRGNNDTLEGGNASDELRGGRGFDVCRGGKPTSAPGDGEANCENSSGIETLLP